MLTEFDTLLGSCLSEIARCRDLRKLEEIRAAVFGKNGRLTAKMKTLKDMSEDERREVGAKINEVKKTVQERLKAKANELELAELERKLANEYLDVSMPVDLTLPGHIHPITKVFSEVSRILSSYGFRFEQGPDIENEHFNFDTLNMPDYHPARAMQDTFYLSAMADENGRKLLRTQTTAIDNRVMTTHQPPMRFFSIGRTFRSDYDATHVPMFNQVEMTLIEKNIGFAHLKWLIKDFLKKFFEVNNLSVRFRPSFFPFTEPSAEVDMNYEIKNGKMVFGTGDKWLEVGGCGVLHPNVLKDGNIDPTKYRGIAFGLGLERLASLKYGVPDLRGYYESNARWRESFGFSPVEL